MLAKKEGASYVAVSEPNEQRGKKALKFGKVDQYFDAKDDELIEKLMVASNGGFDKVIECCGNSARR